MNVNVFIYESTASHASSIFVFLFSMRKHVTFLTSTLKHESNSGSTIVTI